jgi:hypothetical protein
MCGSFPELLIGRTAVHSGKDPAFVAYDQFLSTGILQPLSRGEGRGSFASILPCPLSCPYRYFRTHAVQQTAAIRSPRQCGRAGYPARPSALAVLRLIVTVQPDACSARRSHYAASSLPFRQHRLRFLRDAKPNQRHLQQGGLVFRALSGAGYLHAFLREAPIAIIVDALLRRSECLRRHH